MVPVRFSLSPFLLLSSDFIQFFFCILNIIFSVDFILDANSSIYQFIKLNCDFFLLLIAKGNRWSRLLHRSRDLIFRYKFKRFLRTMDTLTCANPVKQKWIQVWKLSIVWKQCSDAFAVNLTVEHLEWRIHRGSGIGHRYTPMRRQ